MKTLKILSLLLLFPVLLMGQSAFYDFTVEDIDGNSFAFSQLEGKKVMLVNVASKCGLTPQYEDLQKLYETFADQNFIIIGFPANNFKKQEPGSNEEIKSFCSLEYGVSFPMMSKISVKGDEMHPVYQWLTQKEKNGVKNSSVKWNFQKYLINEKGELEHVINPMVKPMNDKIVTWIEGESK